MYLIAWMLNLDFFSGVIYIRKIHSLYERVKFQICFLRSEINTAIWFQLSSEKTKFLANHNYSQIFDNWKCLKWRHSQKFHVRKDPSQIYLLVNSYPGFMNDRPMLMPYDPWGYSTVPFLLCLLYYSNFFVRSQISFDSVRLPAGISEQQVGIVAIPNPRDDLHLFNKQCTLTNILLDSRPGFVNNWPMSMAYPPLETTSPTHSLSFVRSQISYDVLDSRPGFVNNRPMSMPSPPLETTSPTNSLGFVRSKISYDL